MKKLALVLITATVASAATQITFNINDTYGLKLLTAFIAQDNSHVTITFRGSQGAGDPNQEDYAAQIDINPNTMSPKQPGETNAQYVKRRVSLIIDACRLAHEKKISQDARDLALAAVPPIDVNEPNEIGE